MSILDIYCNNSFSSAWINCPITQKNYHLFVGDSGISKHFSCLYFTLPPIENLGSIQSVTLYLFHTPLHPFCRSICKTTHLESYLLYPLKEFYTPYSYTTLPILDYDNGQTFYSLPHRSCTEIDVTQLVRSWMIGTLPNKGLLLLGATPDQLMAYGSNYSCPPNIAPFLRINYLPVTSADTRCVVEGTTVDLTPFTQVYIDSI